jgi:hypothetical protein
VRGVKSFVGTPETLVKEFNDLYSFSNIVRLIKSRRMRWVGHVAYMGEKRDIYRVLLGKPDGRRMTTWKTQA